MPIEEVIVLTDIGLYCPIFDFYLDPKRPVKNAVISHAHGDHAVGGSQNVFCTAPTKAIMDLRYKKNAGKNFLVYQYGETFTIGSAVISFFSAGHILGSAQVLIVIDGKRYLYTGDFKLASDETVEAFDFVKADVLITETTFANKETVHPDAEQEIIKLNSMQGNIILGAYALGKAQRITQLINNYCVGKRVLAHYSIAPIHRVYEGFGVNLGKWQVYDRKTIKHSADNVYIVPPLTFSSYRHSRDVLKVFASGWDFLQSECDEKLFISDHADWKEIINLIDKVEPSQIWTLHGDGRQLKEHLEGKIDVKILNE
ncbi:MBL fold metallo-hydrolase RNA specificity domain-containing protein [Solitalea koreensis]|uniref:Putative mRNA 3-end processing factor n=1 Tax=Solitalea koreensis TaxID=543615 RepID=A0A521D7N5_9SPHI|nr:MBL fold metallo-hydrolase RNA specificity domain-containing protein [Solitalea koreensis]SMO67615.1 putative mRNA 3-end processing factor [Solitalea koreensis]